MLGIEIINVCNFNCYFCGSQFTENHQIMDNDKFFSILDNAKKVGVRHLDLTPIDGELFVDRHILEKLERALQDFSVEFFTNFGLCYPHIQDKLKILQNKYDLHIKISDYGDGDKEVFKKFTRTTDKEWYTYRDNLDYANKINLKKHLVYRGINYNFDCGILDKDEIDDNMAPKSGVCIFQFTPRLHMNGDLVYCLCGESKVSPTDEMVIGNIYEESFEEVYLSKKRLKIFKDQIKEIYNVSCSSCEVFESGSGFINTYKMYNRIKER